ncbi:MAG: hypothetical protein ACLGJC_10105 [Alphaproteobacteria bacterium]
MAKTHKPAAEPVAVPVEQPVTPTVETVAPDEQAAPVETPAASVTAEQPVAAVVVPADPAREPREEEVAPDPLSRAMEAAEVEEGHVRLSLEHYEALTVADLHRLCGTLTGRPFQGAAVHPATRTVTL